MVGGEEWHLHVLGPFELEHAGRHIHMPRRKVASLLAYLILHPQKHRREELAGLFWGDFPDSEALHSLRTALTALRSTADTDILSTDSETVRFNPTFPLWVDALAFQSYGVRFLAETPYDLCTSFIDLYRGDLLPDFDDDWIIPERERLRGLYVDVLLHTAQQMRSRSDYERAIGFARRVLAIEPANERAHQHIMFCFIALGDRYTAMRQYGECKRALEADLATAPLPETIALYRWIRGQTAATPAREALLTNLPIPVTSFVGREQEMADIKRWLAECRLLTLTGPGGSGKTRLAIKVATDLVDAYKDGVWFTDLTALRDPAQVATAVARTLHVETPGSPLPTDALVAVLRNRCLLLVLDNCEHLIGECAQLTQDLLAAVPQVKILATSREILDVPGEVIFRVPALSTPAAATLPSLAALAGFEATRLFIERATAAYPELALSDPDCPTIAAICRQLDGMPLSIELAAARVKVLTVGQIAGHLQDRFTLLASSGRARPPRQSSLRAAIDWSYDLLPADEQALLRQLSVFVGSFPLAGASAVYTQNSDESSVLELLARLVDKSLLMTVESGEDRRYRLLETIRLYAWDKLLAAGARDEVVHCYVAFISAIVKRAGEDYMRSGPEAGLREARTVVDDILAAVAWCVELGDVTAGLQMFTRPQMLQALRLLPALAPALASLLAADDSAPTMLRGMSLVAAATVADMQGDYEQAKQMGEEGVALCRASGDTAATACAILRLGRSEAFSRNIDRAVSLYKECLAAFRDLGYRAMATNALLWLSDAYTSVGDYARAYPFLVQGLAEARKTDNVWAVQYALRNMGLTTSAQGNYTLATELYAESLTMCIRAGLWHEVQSRLIMMATCAAGQDQFERALVLLGAFQGAGGWPNPATQSAGGQHLIPLLSAIRAQLGDALFDALVARGQAMTLEQAAEYALVSAPTPQGKRRT
jgi:predicted ATPase/DNA-binding SARP family transcriptional activator